MQKVISNHKLLNYFGITELTQQESALFFIHIQEKLPKIYNLSTFRAIPSPLNLQNIRNQHVAHISTLLTGGGDNNFINKSNEIWQAYQSIGVSHGEYVKLYQLIISYITSEAHKKYWYKYRKYRQVSRAIRNLLMFDLALSMSFQSPIQQHHTTHIATAFSEVSVSNHEAAAKINKIDKKIDQISTQLNKKKKTAKNPKNKPLNDSNSHSSTPI